MFLSLHQYFSPLRQLVFLLRDSGPFFPLAVFPDPDPFLPAPGGAPLVQLPIASYEDIKDHKQ